MTIHDLTLSGLDGEPLELADFLGRAVLVVNVASKCGLTPQYTGLEALQERFADKGFSVLGAPCNQFGGQEPGSAEEIEQFCSTTYGVTFPLTEKLEVNGKNRHPLFDELVKVPDEKGEAGDIVWNFEKFLVSPAGEVVARFRPTVVPDSDAVIEAIEAALPRWRTVPGHDIEPGDVVRIREQPLRVTRVEQDFMGNEAMIALIEDTPSRWIKRPVKADTGLEVLETH